MVFHKLKIIDKKQETPQAVSIAFDIPNELKNDFKFEAGQYVNLKTFINGEEIRRSYSISSAPHENDFRIVVKAIENGIFSNFAVNELKIGDEIEVSIPEGKFFLENKEAKIIAGIASGSGITPIISLAKDILQNENKKFILIYGNKTVVDTIYHNEIQELKAQYPNRLFVYQTYSKEIVQEALNGRIGRSTINFVFLAKQSDKKVDEFFICGPEEMIMHVKEALVENKVNEEQIHYELFYTAAAEDTIEAKGTVKVTVLVDGVESSFEMDRNTDILTAALKNGIDAPYSCQGGICSSCMCKSSKGSAMMKVNHILSEDEIEEGLLLACQSYVISDEIYVDFDDV
ncbi:2Fe-2S iron-sulfur cluster-binding protein [Capnocytophaga sp. ARDL2]|uniref:2Fe-2S iron-sulfur cluster-binding protein n=1 Tax=Capnocytophaga sp. ARDL2 TaxID=3238809 RepID=UPI003558061F